MPKFSDLKKAIAIDKGTSIPLSIVELPSNGAKASLRPMKIREQREFLKALEKKDEYLINEAFDKILSACVISINDEPYDGDKVCIQDRSFLLIKVRQVTTGDIAKISHISPKTNEVVNNVEVDLSKLPVDKFTGTALTKVVDLTPSIKVKLGPVTRKDEKNLEEWTKKNSVVGKDGSRSVIDRRYCAYAAIIKTISMKDETTQQYIEIEDLSFSNKVEFITESCSQKDLEKFDEFFSTLDFGIRLRFHFKTDDYENESEEADPISFFIM